MMETVEELRASGNELFKAGKFSDAVEKYSDALAIEPDNHLLYSNRSLAHCSAGNHDEAIADAEVCLRIDAKFMKGYYRLANAQAAADKFDEAEPTIRRGLVLEPENPELKKLLRLVKAKHDAARRLVKKPKAAGPAVDDDTRKHMHELSEQLASSKRELQETASRSQAVRREMQRGALTAGEIDGVDEGQRLYRSIGKMFLRNTKPQIQELLVQQASKGDERAAALAGRQQLLERNVDAMQHEFQAMQDAIQA
ncbi:hypothetical protein M885DRAFT_506022 [Pelagophyceae sp. CCMP2097]|nr:hypothetical protein M885DRAFT_506022 [Pelagophyceae sp. CCMP2097]